MYKHAKSKKPGADIGPRRFVVAHYWPNKGRSVRSSRAWPTIRQAKKEYERLVSKGGERFVRLLVDGELAEEFGDVDLRDMWFEQNPAPSQNAKKSPSPSQQLIARCRKLWEGYDAKPTKGRLVTLTDHLEKMKGSRSVAVKSERSRALRVVNREWKAQGWVKPKPRRNPVNPWKAKRDAISEKYGIEKFHSSYHPRDRHLSVDLISVLEESRGEGRASGAMKDTLDWADANGVTVTVSPTSEFGSSKRRLEKWYRSMGFVPNRGRNKDFRFTDSMLRVPKAANPRREKRNPIHHSPRHEVEIHVLDKAGWHVILEPSSIEEPDESTINAVQLVDPDNEAYYALVTRSAREPGRWQATRFDERGPVGHSTKDTLIEAVNDTRKWYGLTVSEVVSKNPVRKRRAPKRKDQGATSASVPEAVEVRSKKARGA